MSERCPYCGADRGPASTQYQCGTFNDDRTVECCLREIAAQAKEIERLKAIVDKLRFALCPHCRQGVPLVNGWHKTESLCECEPNEFTDERSTVGYWVICPVEVAKEKL